ncbi:MAG: nucleotidyltransferase family protein [Acidimicrobiia bacterium]
MSEPTGIILAAGASERMGTPKQLLPFGDSTMLNTTITAFQSSQIENLIVVVGASGSTVADSIDATEVTIAENPDYRRGNVSSLLTAVGAIPSDAYILAAGDLPELRTEAIDALAEAWATDPPWAAVTRYRDKIAHPFLLSAAAVEEATRDDKPHALWKSLVLSDDPRVRRVAADYEAPRDINTPGDYLDAGGKSLD